MSDALENKAFAFFCRHLVGMAIVYRHESDPDTKPSTVGVYSGTLLLVGGSLSWLTAGHVIEEIEELHTRADIRVVSCCLLDMFGHETKNQHPIPFVWLNAAKTFLNEDGLDFGFVEISAHYARLLAANGVKGVDDNNWSTIPDDLDTFFVVGFPSEIFSSDIGADDTIALAPVLQSIEPFDGNIDDLNLDPVLHPIFIGKIVGNTLRSLKGMSGGPIIGLRSRDTSVYWIVAIQRSQKGRVLTGCPLRVLGKMVSDAVAKATERDRGVLSNP